MEFESTESSQFNVQYHIDEGWVHAKGSITRGGVDYEVSIDVQDPLVRKEDVKNIYDKKILDMIEGFQIGDRISELHIEKDKISQKPVEGPPLEPMAWNDYKENIKKREKEARETSLYYSTTLSEGDFADSLKKLNQTAFDARHLRTFIQGQREALSKEPWLQKSLHTLLSISLEKEVQQIVEPLLSDHAPPIRPLSSRQITPLPPSKTSPIQKTANKNLTFLQKATRTLTGQPLRRVLYKFFYDGNATWKQQKYGVALGQTLHAFETLPLQSKEGKPLRMTPPQPVETLLKNMETKEKPTPLEKLAGTTLRALNDMKTSKDQRKTYRRFIDSLRNGLNSSEFKTTLAKMNEGTLESSEDETAAKILLDLCLVRFTENKMFSFNDTLVHAMMEEGQAAIEQKESRLPETPTPSHPNPLSATDFEKMDALPHEFKAPAIVTKFESFLGHMNLSFDPHFKSNIPYVNYDIAMNGKNVTCLRVGTPTIQTHPWSTEINPEFKALLETYKALGKKHVYFSLQRGKSSGYLNSFGNEQTRTDAIKQLAADYPGTFYAIVLDQDSSFYQQKGEYGQATIRSENFINTFHQKMLDPQNPSYSIPPQLLEKDPEFPDKMKELMWQLHGALYEDPSRFLNRDERKDFIELYYTVFELLVIKTLDADSFNTSCKDAIDRGGKSNALLLKMIQIMTNQEQDEKNIRALKTTGLAASLLVRFRTVLKKHERRKRLIDPMATLNQPQNAERLRKGFSNSKELFGIDKKSTLDFHEDENIEYRHRK